MNEDYWSVLFGLGPTIQVNNLNEDDSRLLIVEPVKEYVTYTDEAINEIYYFNKWSTVFDSFICDEVIWICSK